MVGFAYRANSAAMTAALRLFPCRFAHTLTLNAGGVGWAAAPTLELLNTVSPYGGEIVVLRMASQSE